MKNEDKTPWVAITQESGWGSGRQFSWPTASSTVRIGVKKKEQPAEPEAEVERLRRQCGELEAERDRLRADCSRLSNAAFRDTVRVMDAERRADLMSRQLRERPEIDRDLVGQLIRLCHPDRHVDGIQDLANAVTARLLELRRTGR